MTAHAVKKPPCAVRKHRDCQTTAHAVKKPPCAVRKRRDYQTTAKRRQETSVRGA